LSIKEQDNDDGSEYKDSAAEISVKNLIKPLRIQYEVKLCAMDVTLWVEFDAGNAIHSKFYTAFDGNGINSPRVVIVVNGEAKSPGTYEALWDGRDQTADHRILLAGTYNVRILGLEDLTHKDATTIKVMPPFGWNFGIHYAGNTTKKEVMAARDAQKSLADGTSFVSEASLSSTAVDAWNDLQISAVGVISGHSNPFSLCLYSEESQPGKPAAFHKSKESVIAMGQAKKPLDVDNSVNLKNEAANALRDEFLIVLAGCRASNEVLAVQMQLKQRSKDFNPGPIDGKHGPKTTAALQHWQEWEHIEPADGTKNDTTLAAMGIDPGLSEQDQTREVQKKLKNYSHRYDPGEADGQWGPKTERPRSRTTRRITARLWM
jgi:peptidoglycan hydrolase-like protein with peptidoglycan-binding domain